MLQLSTYLQCKFLQPYLWHFHVLFRHFLLPDTVRAGTVCMVCTVHGTKLGPCRWFKAKWMDFTLSGKIKSMKFTHKWTEKFILRIYSTAALNLRQSFTSPCLAGRWMSSCTTSRSGLLIDRLTYITTRTHWSPCHPQAAGHHVGRLRDGARRPQHRRAAPAATDLQLLLLQQQQQPAVLLLDC